MSVLTNKSTHIARLQGLSILYTLCGLLLCTEAAAQSVCLPAPRLLTTFPMGGQPGSEFEIVVTGQYAEQADELRFSDPGITAVQSVDANGNTVEGRYRVRVAPETKPGLVEASLMTRLGLSASRVFTVGQLTEFLQVKGNQTLEKAMPIELNSVGNAVMTPRAIDFYRLQAKKSQRIIVDCAAKGIDSKLNPVVIVADAEGQDLKVERRGGAIDFHAPEDGSYIIKVHDLTFKGGDHYFYRLHVTELPQGQQVQRHATTRKVNAFSWPPVGLPMNASLKEIEPNDSMSPQQIQLPCDLAGAFATPADTDVFEFNASKGETWWVEVASERLGRPTDPTVIVQHLNRSGETPIVTDLAELNDIPSPIKVSSNGYAYDGPPYNAGSSDVLGKFEVKEDGLHRLRISDLFGGTRTDPGNVYRLIIRQAKPDFALVAWGMHMQLRNGDRNALSKPIALRGGSTMALEVVAVRRDGFAGAINLSMENLPDGVTCSGLTIPAGKSRGVLLVTADEGAPRGVCIAKIHGSASIGGQEIRRNCELASMAWPVPNHWNEVPSPRLLSDALVSVGGDEPAPISIAPQQAKIWEATEGEKLTIPLIHMRRSEFSGSIMAAKTLGDGFEKFTFDLPLDQDTSKAVVDLAALKTAPGDYLIAFYGGAVAKYQHHPKGIQIANDLLQQATAANAEAKLETARLKKEIASGSADSQVPLAEKLKTANVLEEQTAARVKAANSQLKAATSAASVKDIVDIVVSEPIRIRVHPRETK